MKWAGWLWKQTTQIRLLKENEYGKWLKKGNCVMLTYPPIISSDFDTSPFVDGLEDVIPTKISEVVGNMEYLEWQLDSWKEIIADCKAKGELDESGVYFWSLWAYLEFGDYDIYQKWLIYWLNLYEKLPHDQPVKKFVNYDIKDREQVERVKLNPIENYFPGQLRGSESRPMGKCPFHDDSDPSFFIFTNNNRFHCFGCGKDGDVLNFIIGLSFQEAIKYLS
jgi:hypothetical protein